MFKFKNGVKLLRGKYKGRKGYILNEVAPAARSSNKRWSVRVQSGIGWVTVLLNTDGLKLVEEQYI